MVKMMITTLGLLFLLNGCTQLTPEKQESAFIVIKTPKMKYADMGFISTNDSKVKVEIYTAGQPLVAWEINGMNICMSTLECMDKESFNKEYLSDTYPDTLLENIFRAKPIFNREGYAEVRGGFAQHIKEGISYSVVSGKRTFRDKLNKILIKVKEQ